MEALPCPFCGGTKISVEEGNTFRWRYAGCNECGAQSNEVRCQTLGDGTPEEWEAGAKLDAIAAWNERSDATLDHYRQVIAGMENEVARLKELLSHRR